MRYLRPPLVDALVALGFLCLALAEIAAGAIDGNWRVTVPTALLFTVPLAWRRVVPGAVAVLVVAGIAARALLDVNASEGLTETIALVFALYWAGLHEKLASSAVALIASGALACIAVAASDNTAASDFVFAGFIVLAPWAAGRVVARIQRRAQAVEQRTGELLSEQQARAEAALADERQRIARELHDVIAHSITVMLMNTGATRRMLKPEQERERQSLATVEATGRTAIAEMRRLVGMLRVPHETLELSPQPGLRHVEQLIGEVRGLGLDVDLCIEGGLPDLAPGLDLAAYRIIQESLTNVVKHARATRAVVSVAASATELRITVADDGQAPPVVPTGGHGLVGMRERANLYGGTLEAGPGPNGGFRVRARLPIEDACGTDPGPCR